MTFPGTTKNFLRLSALAFCGFIGTIFADDFKSKVITPTTPMDIHVSGDALLFIRNFTQEDDGSATRGVIMVTKGGDTAQVLTAAILDTSTANLQEVINSIVIAGPADVTVTCGATTGNCFVSYKKESN